LYAEGTVGIPAREDHADGAIAMLFGKRGEQNVGRVMASACTGCHANAVTGHRQRGIGRYHVNMVGCHHHTVVRGHYKKIRFLGKNFGQQTLVIWIEMLDDNTGHAAFGRQGGEQLGKRFKAARGGGDGYNGNCHMALLSGESACAVAQGSSLIGGSIDPKAAEIIGLYLHPPQHAAVFCVGETTAIQALDRKRRTRGC
jgi:hypothetical protein